MSSPRRISLCCDSDSAHYLYLLEADPKDFGILRAKLCSGPLDED